MKLKKNKLALGVASAVFAIAGVISAPQALAASKAERVAAATDKKVHALELQVQQMNSMMRAMQSELARVKSAPAQSDPKVIELNEWMVSVKSQPIKEDTKDNMIFFRGGYSNLNASRSDLLTGGGVNASNGANLTGVGTTSKDGWYIGAGFDFSIDDNLFGLMDNTEVLAELMFDYREYGKQVSAGGATNTLSTVANGAILGATGGALGLIRSNAETVVTVSEFTINASPKIKFMKGSKFRPWLIPVGLQVTVISPPTDGVTVFQPGMMFGAGADYEIWKNIYVGADVRYNLSLGKLDGVNTDGLTAGGYLGLGF
jgi:opacity protein-like surface antigen